MFNAGYKRYDLRHKFSVLSRWMNIIRDVNAFVNSLFTSSTADGTRYSLESKVLVRVDGSLGGEISFVSSSIIT